MRLKTINNNKGSALLWCILMTVILTILLGAVYAATAAYFNYTINTVKKQQAYFTARSVMDAIVTDLSDQTYETKVVDGVSTQVEAKSRMLPEKGEKIELTDFDLGDLKGTIKEATIERKSDSPNTVSNASDKLLVSVTANFAGKDYTIKSTLMCQPLYFAGIAIKDLNLGGNLSLGKNTDLYWNNTNTFYSRSQSTGKSINVKGNLVTKGDATIYAGATIAGHPITSNVTFSNKSGSRYKKQIWSPSEYILANKTLDVFDTATTYESSTLNTLRNLFNGTTTRRPCNNTSIDATSFGRREGVVNDIISFLAGQSNLVNDISQGANALEDTSTGDSLTIKYIKLYTYSLLGSTYNTRDISFIGFKDDGEDAKSDTVVPIVYLLVDKNQNVRVRYGKDPGHSSLIGSVNDYISGRTDELLAKYFKYTRNLAYTVVYLEEGAKINLGCKAGMNATDLSKRTPENLTFAYSIYGQAGSEVILEDGVTVLGEIQADKLTIKPGTEGVNIVYSTTNGSQVAKQKVDQYWTVVSYSDHDIDS